MFQDKYKHLYCLIIESCVCVYVCLLCMSRDLSFIAFLNFFIPISHPPTIHEQTRPKQIIIYAYESVFFPFFSLHICVALLVRVLHYTDDKRGMLHGKD